MDEDKHPWDVFYDELRRFMDEPMTGKAITAPALASDLGVDVETVRNWRKRRARPSIDLLPAIGRALRMCEIEATDWDPTYLPRKMGVLPNFMPSTSALLDRVVAMENVESRVTRAQEAGSRVGMAAGASLIVQRACELGDWAVGVLPAVEGVEPVVDKDGFIQREGCMLHVADRITFMRADLRPIERGSVQAAFGDLLAACQALKSTHTVTPRWQTGEVTEEPYWSIPRVGATRVSEVDLPWSPVRSIAVVAMTTQSWANDIASHLADVLGYGQLATRQIANDLAGVPLPTFEIAEETRAWRRTAHQRLLDTLPDKRVWSHFDHLGPVTADTPPPPPGLKVVFVRESDDVLRSSSLVRTDVITFNDLKQRRDRTVALVEQMPNAVVVEMNPNPSTVRRERWNQVLLATRDTLRWLSADSGLNAAEIITQVMARAALGSTASQRGREIVGWLRGNGWPADGSLAF